MPMKRRYSSILSGARSGGPRKTAKYLGTAFKRAVGKSGKGFNRRVRSIIDSQLETKESGLVVTSNTVLPHNGIVVPNNPIVTTQGTGDPMTGTGQRIGDKITIKGLLVKGMFENAMDRSKVHYRVMMIKSAKGDAYTAADLFKGNSANKMIDQVNTDRFTVLASKRFTISTVNSAPTGVSLAGVPTGTTPAGIGVKYFSMWIPGTKIVRNGMLQYQDASTNQPKFFDYRIVVLAYDWFGTPGTSNVGLINSMYTKMYYKDA